LVYTAESSVILAVCSRFCIRRLHNLGVTVKVGATALANQAAARDGTVLLRTAELKDD